MILLFFSFPLGLFYDESVNLDEKTTTETSRKTWGVMERRGAGGVRGEGVKEKEQMMMRNDLIYSDTVKMK